MKNKAKEFLESKGMAEYDMVGSGYMLVDILNEFAEEQQNDSKDINVPTRTSDVDILKLPDDDAVYYRAFTHFNSLRDTLTKREVAEHCFMAAVDWWHFKLTGKERE